MFPSTRQSLVGRPAQGEFFELYRMPCLRYVKWRYPGLEAEDLVQGFFAAVLEQGIVEKFDPAKGRFRPYLRTCLDQFIAKQRIHASREKRGGHLERVELDEAGISGGENPGSVLSGSGSAECSSGRLRSSARATPKAYVGVCSRAMISSMRNAPAMPNLRNDKA
ncbi:MAG: hypothetical protein FJW36_03480 [Acidobacteria bacterium]|nr:hypothetical protein [Acidobacteriota bacterium]